MSSFQNKHPRFVIITESLWKFTAEQSWPNEQRGRFRAFFVSLVHNAEETVTEVNKLNTHVFFASFIQLMFAHVYNSGSKYLKCVLAACCPGEFKEGTGPDSDANDVWIEKYSSELKIKCRFRSTDEGGEAVKEQLEGEEREGPEIPPRTTFRCRGHPTAQYCRRAVVMETARLFRRLHETRPPPPPRPPCTDTRPEQEPDCSPYTGFLWPVDKDRTGGAGTQEVASSETRVQTSVCLKPA